LQARAECHRTICPEGSQAAMTVPSSFASGWRCPVVLTLYSLDGRCSATPDLGGCGSGIYLVRASCEGSSFSRRLVVL